MSAIDWTRVAEIFADALDRPEEERAAFVAGCCAGQPALLAAVQRLLDAEALAAPAFMKGLDPPAIGAIIRAVAEAPERAGAYRLIREIGRGGMGQVFLAERADGQFEQRAAVKLLKRGMDSDAILARFIRERQILAGLNHPNIARLIDGGIAEDGRPYLVMEYVEGQPITHYCDAHRLSIAERLQLFCDVLLGVEYAHRNLVVHRDLKPSNILVTADGQPKLLDFGIAKVLSAGRHEADATTLTQAGARMLTPDYAAPEQFRAEAITTSTDVYSLGAVLYELLAGRRPFAARSDRAPEEEAAPLTAALPDAVATARSTDAGRLRRQLAGDLETIVMTALRPLQERRYTSVEALRDDIRRFQQQLPLKARPDTTVYRLSRFVRRNRIGVFASTAIAALVLAFAITAALQADQIRKQASALEVERDRAQGEAAAANSVSNFLVGVFEVSDPMAETRGDSILARELLDRGAERIDADLSGQPELQARMLSVMGRAYYNLSRSDRAVPLLQRAVELQRAAAGDTSAAVVAALQQLAQVQQWRDQAGAVATLREAVALQERIDGDDALMWSLLVDLALVYHRQGEAEQYGSTVADALVRLEKIPPEQLAASHETLHQYIALLRYTRDWEKLDVSHRKLVEVEQATDGPRSAAVAIAYASWAEARQQGVHSELADRQRPSGPAESADSLVSLALAIVRDLDVKSPRATDALVQVAAVLRNRGALPQADSLYRVAIEVLREQLGDDHRTVALVRSNLAITLQRRDMPAEAIPLFESVIATLEQQAESGGLLEVNEWRLATALRDAGRIAESVPQFQIALRDFEDRFPPDYILTANIRREFGGTLIEVGRFREAETLLRAAIQVLAKRWGESDARVDEARVDLGRALSALGRYAEAEEVLAGARNRLEQSRGSEDTLAQRARAAHQALLQVRSRTGG